MKPARMLIIPALLVPALCLALANAAHAQSNSVPFLNQPLVPDAVPPGAPAFTLTVNGSGFVTGATVNWNASPRTTTFVSASQLTAQINAADVATTQTASVTATNPGAPPSNPMFFQVALPSAVVNFARTDLATGMEPDNVVVGDFNGDGRPDLAVVAAESNSIMIFLGNGDGTFTPGATLPDSYGPGGITAADFNGNGKLDLAVANDVSNNISIFLGNGDGTFQPQMTFPTGNNPSSPIAADFNGDGKLDILTTNFGAATVSVLLGNGDGTFQTHIDSPTGRLPLVPAAGDFNKDGHLDLAVSILNGPIQVLLGNGDGTFQAAADYAVDGPGGLTIADFNGDGNLDIAATSGAAVDILLGNGDGTFQAAIPYATTGGPNSLIAGDFNGDSKLDLAVVGLELSLLLGNGDGSFQPHVDYAIGSGGAGLSAGDFNGDGLLDLAVVNFDSNTVSTLLQTTLVVSPLNLNLGFQGVLTISAPQTITLTNTGATAIPINSVSIAGIDAGDFAQTNTCGTSLAGGATCTISVTFTPKGIGTRTASLSISDGAAGSPQIISLTGVGEFARYLINPANLHFGSHTVGTTSKPQNIKLSVRNYALAITSISFSGVNASDFAQTNDCTPEVQPDSFCKLTVTFTPSGTGTRSAKMILKGGFTGGFTDVPVNGIGVN